MRKPLSPGNPWIDEIEQVSTWIRQCERDLAYHLDKLADAENCAQQWEDEADALDQLLSFGRDMRDEEGCADICPCDCR